MNDREPEIDPEFTALPLRDLADAALAQAKALGAQHADFRAERLRAQQIVLSDGTPQTLFDADDTGLAVRVIVDGTWGFAIGRESPHLAGAPLRAANLRFANRRSFSSQR